MQNEKMIIPHMGWNKVYAKQDCPLFKDMDEEMRFYFVHSYYVECENKKEIAGETEYDVNMSDVFFRDLGLPKPHHYLEVGGGLQTAQTGKIMIENVPIVLFRNFCARRSKISETYRIDISEYGGLIY